jgi:tRNA synthetases class I (I, L, M and V)
LAIAVLHPTNKLSQSSCFLYRTLPSNLALCVNPDFVYVRVRDPATGKTYIVAESRLAELPGAVPKQKKGKKGEEAEKGFEVGFHYPLPTAASSPRLVFSCCISSSGCRDLPHSW